VTAINMILSSIERHDYKQLSTQQCQGKTISIYSDANYDDSNSMYTDDRNN